MPVSQQYTVPFSCTATFHPYKLKAPRGTLLIFNGITVAFFMSRRHTSLADVPRRVSQTIIKLSFGDVRQEIFDGCLACPGSSSFRPTEEMHQRGRGRRTQYTSFPPPHWPARENHLKGFPFL